MYKRWQDSRSADDYTAYHLAKRAAKDVFLAKRAITNDSHDRLKTNNDDRFISGLTRARAATTENTGHFW